MPKAGWDLIAAPAATARTLSLDDPAEDPRQAVKKADPIFPTTCYLTGRRSLGDAQLPGTAILIGPDVLITAGHNVFNPKFYGAERGGGYCDHVVVTPGFGVQPTSAAMDQSSARVVAHAAYTANINTNLHCDIAVVLLNKPYTHTNTFPRMTATPVLQGAMLRVAGYPTGRSPFEMVAHSGVCRGVGDQRLCYDAQTSGGQSGGPVYAGDPASLTLVGVHTYGYKESPAQFPSSNSATLLSVEMIDWVGRAEAALRG